MRQRAISGLAGWQRAGRVALCGAILGVCMGGCNKAAPGPSVTIGTVVEAAATSVPATVAPTATATVVPSSTATATAMSTVTPTSSPTSTATDVPEAAPGVDLSEWRLPLMVAVWTAATAAELERLAVESPEGARQAAFALGIALGAFYDGLEDWEPGPDQAVYEDRLRANMVGVGQVIGAWTDGGAAGDVPAALGPWRAASDQMVSELVDELVRRGADQGELDAFVADVLASVTEAMAGE